ncbi:hypothetical protein NNC19_03110 [Clostridium sp. SHJSY1]|uniref:hypothetical protein n=1 Tax=Clostridium sp. SHJSY1 TaxID=2942483 RepID=UPI00287714E8|nr:hypothetical protein [Clostridium sp. SHJSY1]MDS0524653.1 hypothetical protein [Clostridium sp. SHJSY1]
MDIVKLLQNNTSGLNEEERRQAEKFTDSLKEKIIEELVEFESDELIKKLWKNREEFVDSLGSILINGIKGYSKMPIELLINIYLEKKSNEDFIELIENIQE